VESFAAVAKNLSFVPTSVLIMQRKPKMVKAFAQMAVAIWDPDSKVESLCRQPRGGMPGAGVAGVALVREFSCGGEARRAPLPSIMPIRRSPISGRSAQRKKCVALNIGFDQRLSCGA
jgi:hypothetical protein